MNMSADIAESDIFDVLLDNDGCLWIRQRETWSYVTDTGLAWDVRDSLPVEYEPYSPLDTDAARLVLRAIKA